jgi:hypothetical protein
MPNCLTCWLVFSLLPILLGGEGCSFHFGVCIVGVRVCGCVGVWRGGVCMVVLVLVVLCFGSGCAFSSLHVSVSRLSPDTTAGPLPTLDRLCPRVTPPECIGEEG